MPSSHYAQPPLAAPNKGRINGAVGIRGHEKREKYSTRKKKKYRSSKKGRQYIFKKIIHSDRGLHLPAYSTNIVSGAFLCPPFDGEGGGILCGPIYQKIKFGRFFFAVQRLRICRGVVNPPCIQHFIYEPIFCTQGLWCHPSPMVTELSNVEDLIV